MTNPLDPNPDYHIALGDDERRFMEQSAFNFRRDYGRAMKIPPRLYSDLQRAGCNMKDMEADASLEI